LGIVIDIQLCHIPDKLIVYSFVSICNITRHISLFTLSVNVGNNLV